MKQQIAVVGAGVIGLTTSISLAKAGYEVHLYSREFSPHTTSDVAAAYFAPLAGLGDPRLKPIVLSSLNKVASLAHDSTYGVRALPLYELQQSPHFPSELEYLSGVQDLAGVFPAPWLYGFAFATFQFDIPTYMPRLMQEVAALGIKIEERTIQDLSELSTYGLVVNCTGLGAKELGDSGVYPIRGQVIRVSRPQGFPDIILSAENQSQITYVVPRLKDIILGGVYEHDKDSLEVDPASAEDIWSRCLKLRPELAQAKIIEHRVGLRPGRAIPRLELEQNPTQNIVHNYGHGSTGHTLAWGCAERVVQLVESARD